MFLDRPGENRVAWASVLLGLMAVLFLFLLHPRIGIRDWDGWSYLVGAVSLRGGRGYRDFAGSPLNRWPPGYSSMLSVAQDPAWAAQVVNYLSFGGVIGLFYFLLRQRDWGWQPALGLTVSLGAGFLRLLASMVHADILTYFVFLCGLLAAMRDKGRTAAGVAWAGLFLLKFIAIVFLPAAAIADWMVLRLPVRELLRRYRAGAAATVAAVGIIFGFDWVTEGTLIPLGHEGPSFHSFARAGEDFVVHGARSFFFDWYGSVRNPVGICAMVMCLIPAAVCIGSLRARPEGRWLRVYGISFFVCCFLLLFVRWYETSPRLIGYGLLALLPGFQPLARANRIWIALGVVSVLAAVVNGVTTNSAGGNDARYAGIARELRQEYRAAEPIATNASFFIFFRDARVVEMDSAEEAWSHGYRAFLWVTLPEYDAVQPMVTPAVRPGKGWCEEKRFEGALLFSRCGGAGTVRPGILAQRIRVRK